MKIIKLFIVATIVLNFCELIADDSLRVVHPNGSEIFNFGDNINIQWEGVPQDQPVDIYFSRDDGGNWRQIVAGAKGHSYIWYDVPNIIRKNCRIKVKTSTEPQIEWQKCFGGSGYDVSESIQQTIDGGYIIAGSTTSDDGDIIKNHGNEDIMIIKIDSVGNLQWQNVFGGNLTEEAFCIQQTIDGGYIFAGYTDSNDGDISFNHGSRDIWVVKLTDWGKIEWEKSFGGSKEDNAFGIFQTEDTGYIVVGETLSVDGDVTNSHGRGDSWIVKLNVNGKIEWEKSLGGSYTDYIFDLLQVGDGDFILVGQTESNNGDVFGNHGSYDNWIVKLNTNGEIQWQKCYGGKNDDLARGIVNTFDDGYMIAGYSNSIDGDLAYQRYSNDFDYWVIKIDTMGDIQWQKNFGGSRTDWAFCIQTARNDSYIIVGNSNSNDNDVFNSKGSNDYWVVKFNEKDNIQWQKCVGGSKYDFAKCIRETKDFGYILAGYTLSNDVDVSGNHGSADAWIVKLSPEPNITIQSDESDSNFSIVDPNGILDHTEDGIIIYPNPSNDNISICGYEGKISILNSLGLEILELNIYSNEAIDISALASGCYVVRMNGNVLRFIKY